MLVFKKGNKYPDFRSSQEVIKFDMDDSGAMLYIVYPDMTDKELSQFSSGSSFEVRFLERYGFDFLMFKFGSLPWMDVDYDIRLSPELSAVPEIDNDTDGISLTCAFFEGRTGELKELRVVGLGNKFSKSFLAAAAKKLDEPLDETQRNKNLYDVRSRFPASSLVDQATDRYKLK